jgi:hypothetical protein
MPTMMTAYTAKKISPILAAADMEETLAPTMMFSSSKSRGSLRNIASWSATGRPFTS